MRAVAVILVFLAGCTSPAKQQKADEEAAARGWNGGLVGTAWIADSIDGHPAFQSPESMLVFQSATLLVGNAGCNTFSGSVGIAGAQIFVGPLAATEKSCAPAVMAQETAFLDAVQNARSFQATDETLVLYGPSGEVAVELERVPESL